MTELQLVEGRWSDPVELDEHQVEQLQALGRRFTSARARAEGFLDGGPDDPTAIQLERSPLGWHLRVDNAVGLLAIDGLHMAVEPKVPMAHLVHLLVRSGRLPSTANEDASGASASAFWGLIARWFVEELARLIRGGIRHGYDPCTEDLTYVRGRLEARRSATNLMRGQVRLRCEFEEFNANTPLNRVLLHAARLVTSSAALERETRQQARQAVTALHGVGPLAIGDLQAPVLSSERTYGRAIRLAKQVIGVRGRGLQVGTEWSRSFLMRTPEPVEEALRGICREALAGMTTVAKRAMPLLGAAESLSPDLLFGDAAVGDVKYKLWSGGWPRGDLYQLLAFAGAFERQVGLRVGFSSSDTGASWVHAGPIRVSRCDWLCAEGLDPLVAEADFKQRMVNWWLESCGSAAKSIASLAGAS